MEKKNNSKVCVVVPVFNESATLSEFLIRLKDALSNLDYKIIFVNDGSNTETTILLRSLAGPRITILENEKNRGKGFSVRRGLAQTDSPIVAYIDGDLDLHPISLIHGMKALEENPEIIAAYGSKRHPNSQIHYPLHRKLMSWGFRALVKWLFSKKVGDTQTGVKVFRRDAILDALNLASSPGWTFDLELTLRIIEKKEYLDAIVEVPIKLNYGSSSQFRIRSIFESVLDLMKLAREMRVKTGVESGPNT